MKKKPFKSKYTKLKKKSNIFFFYTVKFFYVRYLQEETRAYVNLLHLKNFYLVKNLFDISIKPGSFQEV